MVGLQLPQGAVVRSCPGGSTTTSGCTDAHDPLMRRRVLIGVCAVVAAGVAGVATWWMAGDRAVDSAPTSSRPGAVAGAPVATPAASVAPPVTMDPATPVVLDDVWLLDAGDGSFEWGIVLEGGDTPRRDIDVTVRLVDDSGGVVFTATDDISVLGARQRSAFGGTASDLPARPVRIEADVAVGFDASRPPDAVTGSIGVRAVERRPDTRAADGSEVVTGRLRSTFAQPVEDLVLAAIWRAPADTEAVAAGDIVAVLFRDVERVRPGVDARFEIPVDGRDVPRGPPDEVLVSM